MRNDVLILGIIVLVICMGIGTFLSYIDYQYQLEKCANLNSSESNYDFNLKLETNAQYNENCYFLKHHPLALFSNISMGIILGLLIGVMITTLYWFFKITLYYRR